MEFKADISRIVKHVPTELIGRESETAILDDAWDKARRHEPQRPHVLTFVALGGEGKTSQVAKWVADLAHRDWPGCEAVFAWSFYSQGSREQAVPLEFVRIEPYILPKKSLSGESTERVDTRVLQVIFRFQSPGFPVYVGQQMDVFIEET